MHTATATATVTATRPVRPSVRPVRPNPRPVPRATTRQAPRRPAPLQGTAVLHEATAERDDPATRGARRRVVTVACAAVVGLTAIAVGFGVGHAAAESDGVAPAPVVYVVQPGDTLWAIAGKVAPEMNAARVVDALRSAAGGSALTPGQRIALPDSLS